MGQSNSCDVYVQYDLLDRCLKTPSLADGYRSELKKSKVSKHVTVLSGKLMIERAPVPFGSWSAWHISRCASCQKDYNCHPLNEEGELWLECMFNHHTGSIPSAQCLDKSSLTLEEWKAGHRPERPASSEDYSARVSTEIRYRLYFGVHRELDFSPSNLL